MVFSAALGLLVWFVIPIACTFLGSLEVLMLALLFGAGGLAFLCGKLFWKDRGPEPTAGP